MNIFMYRYASPTRDTNNGGIIFTEGGKFSAESKLHDYLLRYGERPSDIVGLEITQIDPFNGMILEVV